MTDEKRSRMIPVLTVLVLISIAAGGVSLYVTIPLLMEQIAGVAAPTTIVDAGDEKGQAETWSDIGDALIALAGKSKGEARTMETAIWCYERSVALTESEEIRNKVKAAGERLLTAKAEEAEKNGAWDVAYKMYSSLYEKSPTKQLELKVEDLKARQASLYYTYLGKAEEALQKMDFDEAIALYEKALECMENEECRGSLLLARIEKQKQVDGADVKAPSFAHMDHQAVSNFFRDNAGADLRITGTISPYQTVPGIRVIGNTTYLIVMIAHASGSFHTVASFSNPDFGANVLDYGHGDVVEITCRVLGSTNYGSVYSVQGITIQKIAAPESFVSITGGRMAPIADANREILLDDYQLVYRQPDIFKGRKMKSRGRVAGFGSKNDSTLVLVAMTLEEEFQRRHGWYGSRGSHTQIHFPGKDSFDWFLDYDEQTDVEFEVEIEGEQKKERTSRHGSSVMHLLLAYRPVIIARGLSIQKHGEPDTLVTLDAGRAKPLENKEAYLKRSDIIARAPSRFLGQKMTWQMPLESIKHQGEATMLSGHIRKTIKISERRSHGAAIRILSYFPADDFIENFMDFVPGEKIGVVGEVCERRKTDRVSHGGSAVYLKGITATRVADERSAVFADKGREHPLENPEEFRKRYYVVRRTPSRYIGKEVTWQGCVDDVDVSAGNVCLNISEIDPVGKSSSGEVMLYFRDVSLKGKLAVFQDNTVVFTGKVMMQTEQDWCLPLEAVSVMLPGNPSSKIDVPQKKATLPEKKATPPGPGPTEQPEDAQ